jgi:chemotaxis protein histidine kinase CheA
LILSTPNLARPTKVIEEPNPYHAKELSEDELRELLRPHFAHVQLLYQHDLSGSGIQPAAAKLAGQPEVVQDLSMIPPAKYLVAVCGARRANVPLSRSLGLGGVEHQIAIVQELRQSQTEIEALRRQQEENEREYAKNLTAHQRDLEAKQEAVEALLRQREENEREYAKNLTAHQRDLKAKQEAVEALLRQREENEREYAKNLAAHQRDLKAKQEAVEALLRQREENEREYAKNLAAHQREIEALLRQREENEREYARNLAAHQEVIRRLEGEIVVRDRQLAELESQNAARKMELEWLYRWIPLNKLARRLFYGRNLRKRLMTLLRRQP